MQFFNNTQPKVILAAILLAWSLTNRLSVVAQVPPSDRSPPNSVIVLGQPCDQPYVVVVPASDPAILLNVQRYVPTAFLTDSRLGQYVQAGASSDRSAVEAISRELRRQGIDAWVAYLPVDCL